jgi:hypothetical protein
MKIVIALQIVFYLILIGFMVKMWISSYKMDKRFKRIANLQQQVNSIIDQANREQWRPKTLYYRLIQAKERFKDEDIVEISMINMMIKDLEPHINE